MTNHSGSTPGKIAGMTDQSGGKFSKSACMTDHSGSTRGKNAGMTDHHGGTPGKSGCMSDPCVTGVLALSDACVAGAAA